MDGVDALQSSAPETKAERIARYKAERRRELAERYGNTEEFTSKYVRRDKKIGETSEAVSSVTKDNGSEPTYSRRGLRSKVVDPVEHTEDEPTHDKEAATHIRTDATLSSKSELVSSNKTSSPSRRLEADDTEEAQVDDTPVSSSKRSATTKKSLFKMVIASALPSGSELSCTWMHTWPKP